MKKAAGKFHSPPSKKHHQTHLMIGRIENPWSLENDYSCPNVHKILKIRIEALIPNHPFTFFMRSHRHIYQLCAEKNWYSAISIPTNLFNCQFCAETKSRKRSQRVISKYSFKCRTIIGQCIFLYGSHLNLMSKCHFWDSVYFAY